jgi:hypothetical protein
MESAITAKGLSLNILDCGRVIGLSFSLPSDGNV